MGVRFLYIWIYYKWHKSFGPVPNVSNAEEDKSTIRTISKNAEELLDEFTRFVYKCYKWYKSFGEDQATSDPVDEENGREIDTAHNHRLGYLKIPHDSIADELRSKLTCRNFFNSGISDADVALDWIFFADLSDLVRDKDVGRWWYIASGVFAAIGTLLWFLAATDLYAWIRVWTGKKVPVDSFIRPTKILILNIFLEDIPQIIIASYISLKFESKTPDTATANVATSIYGLLNKLAEACDAYGTRSSIPQLVRVHTLLPGMAKVENEQRSDSATDRKLLAEFAAQVEGRYFTDGRYSTIQVPEGGWSKWKSFTVKAMKAGDLHFDHDFDLTKAKLESSQMEELLVALKDNTFIKSLRLDGNHINKVSAEQLTAFLLENVTIEGLYLANTQIKIVWLQDLLRSSCSIHHLSLSNNQLGNDGAKMMANMLKNNTKIIHLDLNHNGIGPEGAKALASAIDANSNSAITYLNLSRNQIGDVGATGMANMLRSNTKITHLDLKNNNIGDKGALALANATDANSESPIAYLNLADNQIRASLENLKRRRLNCTIYFNQVEEFPWDNLLARLLSLRDRMVR
jgi:hypothetical protein